MKGCVIIQAFYLLVTKWHFFLQIFVTLLNDIFFLQIFVSLLNGTFFLQISVYFGENVLKLIFVTQRKNLVSLFLHTPPGKK